MHFFCGKFAAKVVDSRQTKFGHNSHPKLDLTVWFENSKKERERTRFNLIGIQEVYYSFLIQSIFNDI